MDRNTINIIHILLLLISSRGREDRVECIRGKKKKNKRRVQRVPIYVGGAEGNRATNRIGRQRLSSCNYAAPIDSMTPENSCRIDSPETVIAPGPSRSRIGTALREPVISYYYYIMYAYTLSSSRV